jgi:hypothetical protein
MTWHGYTLLKIFSKRKTADGFGAAEISLLFNQAAFPVNDVPSLKIAGRFFGRN